MTNKNTIRDSGLKDNFSTQSNLYAKFRPTYPKALYDFLLANVNQTDKAWDCATGNGQVAIILAETFQQVYATDISSQQLAKAPQKANIIYKVERAEQPTFESNTFDLITVAQAIHWFKFADFFTEVRRVLKPKGLFAAIGYGLMHISPEIDQLILRLYSNILGTYWDEERKHIENNYANIPFSFNEIKSPTLTISTEWHFEQLTGYLETWSSLQHYIKANDRNPIEFVYKDLKKAWGTEEKMAVNFPLIIKAGKFDD